MVQLLRHNWLSLKTVFDHHMESSYLELLERPMAQLHRHIRLNWLSLKFLFDHHMLSSGIVEKDHGPTTQA